MQQPVRRAGLVAGTLLVVLAESVMAKAPTVRLAIEGPGLLVPIETTAPAALASIWAGSFIAEPSGEPDVLLPRYLVTFYVRWANKAGETIQPMYAVRYVHDPRSGRGFVYLPGRGEDGYAMNVGSIARDGQDGRWHRADPKWSDAIVKALSARSSTPLR